MEKCKRCITRTVLTDADIEKMVREIRNMRSVTLADDETYKKRLDICKECEKFEYGSTCALCGCVMHARALLKNGRCPYPKAPKW